MPITVQWLVATGLVVQARRSSYTDWALRWCHCLSLLLVRIKNALNNGRRCSVFFSPFAVLLTGCWGWGYLRIELPDNQSPWKGKGTWHVI